VVVDERDGEHSRCRLDHGVPRYGGRVREVEDLGWGISHVSDRPGGDV